MKPRWSWWTVAFLVSSTLQGCIERDLPNCPEEPWMACPRRQPGDSKVVNVSVSFTNKGGVDLRVFWCSPEGQWMAVAKLRDRERVEQDTSAGQVFHVRASDSEKFVRSIVVPPSGDPDVVITPCVGMRSFDEDFDTSRWPEFERLAAAAAETPCEGPSSQWSCARRLELKEVQARDPALFGFTADEAAARGNPYKAGATMDHIHKHQLPHIPNVTEFDGGYLRMQMTDTLKKLLQYYQNHKTSVYKHGEIGGFFSNHHVVHMDMLDMSFMLEWAVQAEMKRVLEWWTKKRLRHTTTFGVRIYRRGSMLINHLDRKDTHLVSAILQVHQVCDKDGGWPVEVVHPHNKGVIEVYLQPGEMLLYEGARITHGRPMRFQGEEFANVFSHFAPTEYTGPTKWRNPHLSASKRREL